jgi:hypothetical protein
MSQLHSEADEGSLDQSHAVRDSGADGSSVIKHEAVSIDAEMELGGDKKRTRYSSRRPQKDDNIDTDAKSSSTKTKKKIKGAKGAAPGHQQKQQQQGGDEDGSTEEQEDHNDWICGVCCLSEAFDGSDLMLCDGPCLRSFHIGCLEKSKDLVN